MKSKKLFQEQSKNFFLILKLEVISHTMSLRRKKIIDDVKKKISNLYKFYQYVKCMYLLGVLCR